MQRPAERPDAPRRRLTPVDATSDPGAGAGEGDPGDAPATHERAPEDRADGTPAAGKTLSARGLLEAARQNSAMLIPVALLGAGVVFVMLGWYGAANTSILYEQIPYLISGGLLGLGLIIVSGFLAASARTQRETAALRREIVRALADGRGSGAPVLEGATPARSASGLFIVPGGRSFHLAGCPIIEGKDAHEVSAAQASAAGYVPCKLCGD